LQINVFDFEDCLASPYLPMHIDVIFIRFVSFFRFQAFVFELSTVNF